MLRLVICRLVSNAPYRVEFCFCLPADGDCASLVKLRRISVLNHMFRVQNIVPECEKFVAYSEN